jgi:hypothetical protein
MKNIAQNVFILTLCYGRRMTELKAELPKVWMN